MENRLMAGFSDGKKPGPQGSGELHGPGNNVPDWGQNVQGCRPGMIGGRGGDRRNYLIDYWLPDRFSSASLKFVVLVSVLELAV
jgi:hypothetical protein